MTKNSWQRLLDQIENAVDIKGDIMELIDVLIDEVKAIAYDEGYDKGFDEGKEEGRQEAEAKFYKEEKVTFT